MRSSVVRLSVETAVRDTKKDTGGLRREPPVSYFESGRGTTTWETYQICTK